MGQYGRPNLALAGLLVVVAIVFYDEIKIIIIRYSCSSSLTIK